jgi:hypothetical protein
MDGALLGALGTVVGPFVGVVVGLVVGKIWDRADERGRWLRDTRIDAYIDHIDKYQNLRAIIRRLATLETRSDWERENKGRRPGWSAYNAALVKVELHGSPTSYASARDVDSHLRDLSVAVSGGRMTIEDWHRERLLMDEAMRSHIDNVRRELKLEKHPDRTAWVHSAPSRSEPSWGDELGAAPASALITPPERLAQE